MPTQKKYIDLKKIIIVPPPKKIFHFSKIFINPLTSPGEVVTVFTYPYLSAGAPAQGEVKGLIEI